MNVYYFSYISIYIYLHTHNIYVHIYIYILTFASRLSFFKPCVPWEASGAQKRLARCRLGDGRGNFRWSFPSMGVP